MSLLKGIKVIDLSRVLAGPYATQILGDLGADVLKVENANGDETRNWGPPFFENDSCYFLAANRNKKILHLDFKKPRELARLKRLISSADVVIENFRVGYLKKYGLDFSSLRKANPRLIYLSITGFGQKGPYASRAGYDLIIQAMGGIMSITGPDLQTPTKVGVAVTDITTGLYAVISILAALFERSRSGRGQYCDLALLDTQISWLSHRLVNFMVTGTPEKPLGNDHPNIMPYGAFATRDKPLVIGVGNDRHFEIFCNALKKNWFKNQKFATNILRVRNRVALKKQITNELRKHKRKHWLNIFESSGIACAPINDMADIAADPQVQFRGILGLMDDGRTPCVRSPMNFSRTPIRKYRKHKDVK